MVPLYLYLECSQGVMVTLHKYTTTISNSEDFCEKVCLYSIIQQSINRNYFVLNDSFMYKYMYMIYMYM